MQARKVETVDVDEEEEEEFLGGSAFVGCKVG